jgi:hypothetical protein
MGTSHCDQVFQPTAFRHAQFGHLVSRSFLMDNRAAACSSFLARLIENSNQKNTLFLFLLAMVVSLKRVSALKLSDINRADTLDAIRFACFSNLKASPLDDC